MFFRTIVKKFFFRFSKFSFLLFLCHNEPTCQKLCLYVEWGGLWPIQRQRGKNSEKTLKGPKNVKNENFEKRKKSFFPIVLKNIFSKNQVTGSKTVACSVLIDKQTKKQRQREALLGLSELPPFSPLSRSGLIYKTPLYRHVCIN